MKVAWVCHHDLTFRGGAEMTDVDMISRAPDGVEVDVVHPRDYARLASCDRVVVSRLEEASAQACDFIAGTSPVFFSHGDVLPRTAPVKKVVLASRPFIAQTPLSLAHIRQWVGAEVGVTMVPYMDMAGIRIRRKENFALWPHRNVEHKGLDLAQRWAAEKGVELRVMSGRPRAEVLDVMSRAKMVVLISRILDGCPRSIREAQLSGCQIWVNDLVGVWRIPRAELRRRTLEAPETFWRYVCA